eukprot:TRINITY_DN4052_c0_g2_i1.p1 TRINITY_DN4052_c0_g2~~TRINITY_DN4052_c0_g2_i1.p1  ORF type:complete len:616 (+),score=84.75 TRINITY_DN4052_c0_g2_i1:99-1946(+)
MFTALFLWLWICSLSSVSSSPPSILFILVDDLGVADLSYSHNLLNSNSTAPLQTPNIDKLAQLKFTRYYTHSICGPSRAALLTGKPAWNLGNPFPMPKGGGLSPLENTFADELKARKYSTHIVGKWGVDYPLPDPSEPNTLSPNGLGPRPEDGFTPLNRGFDTFLGLYGSGHDHFTKQVVTKYSIDWHFHNQTHQLDYPHLDIEPTEYSTHIFVREAKRIISKWKSDQPSLLLLSFTAPHDPLQVPPKYISENSSCAGISNWRRRYFCGMVAAIDEGVGELVETLKRNEMLQHTLIVFTSDNGGAPSVGGFNYPYRGQKSTCFEGGIHVPALLHAPIWLGNSSRMYSNLMHVSDWAPTILGIVDKVSGKFPSHEILGTIYGVDHSDAFQFKAIDPPRDSLLAEYNIVLNNTAYIKGRWKLLLGHVGRGEKFTEPHGFWYDSVGRPTFILEELFCNFVDVVLGPNWFPISWAFRFQFDRWTDILFGGEKSSFGITPEILDGPFNGTVMVNESTLPRALWGEFERGFVRLYDLEVDPEESNNLARQYPELVAKLVEEVRTLTRGGPGHHYSVQKQFYIFMGTVNKLLMCVGFVGLILSVLFCRCYRRKGLPKKQKNE